MLYLSAKGAPVTTAKQTSEYFKLCRPLTLEILAVFSFRFLILNQDDTTEVRNTVKYRLKPCHFLSKSK